MYNTIKIALIFLVWSLANSSIKAQRNVFWIHGNGSTVYPWNYLESNLIWNGANGTYKLNTISGTGYPIFNTKNGVTASYDPNYGKGFVEDFVDKNPSSLFAVPAGNQPTIAICHSMGGLMMRNYDLNPNYAKIGGIITVGSPLRGAHIANSFMDGSVKSFIDNGSYLMTRAINNDFNPVTWLVQELNDVNTQLNKFNYGTFSQSAGGFTSPPTVADLAENSSTTSTIYKDANHSATSTPKLSIYGNESSPVFWRLIGSGEEKGPNMGEKTKNDLSYYFSTQRDIAYGSYILGVGLVSDVISWFNGNSSFFIGSEYNDAWNWVNWDSENGWLNVDGANTFTAENCINYRCIDDYAHYYGCANQYPNNTGAREACQSPYFHTCHVCSVSPVNYKTDGLIVATSAIGFNTPSWANAESPQEALGVNHLDLTPKLYSDGSDPLGKMSAVFHTIFDKTTSSFYTPSK